MTITRRETQERSCVSFLLPRHKQVHDAGVRFHCYHLINQDVHTAVWLAKVYAPAVTLGSLSLACMFGSHHTMSRRNASLTAAYIAIDKAFNEYKGRVTERFGDRVQQELERNMKAVPVATKVQNEEGVEETIQEYKDVAMAHTSPYDQLFDETVDTWQPDNRLNRNYLFLIKVPFM